MAPILYGIPDTLILVLSSQPGNAPCRPGARSQERPHLKTETGEHLKPRSQYGDDAVQLAIAGKWDEAAKLNKFIIESFGTDEETQNRLGKALSELGKLKDAKAAYEVALKLNPMNSIAKKNAARINALLHQKEGLKVGGTKVDLNLFVEEMGKTVITSSRTPWAPTSAPKSPPATWRSCGSMVTAS